VIGPDLYSFRELWRHYRTCRRNNPSIRAWRYSGCTEIVPTALSSGRTAAYRRVCFVTDGPKPREVFAADFRDRIVHHLLVSHQERVFEPIFIHDSYACRKGKGTLAASDRLMTFVRRVTANGRRRAWALKLDVASFFPSIDKQILFELLAARIRHPELLWLTRVVLFHDPTADYAFKWRGRFVKPPESEGYPIAAPKSPFGKRNERGLPIGNLTSQFWGNVYLNELDQFVKRHLRCRYYLRYVDDLVFLSERPEELIQWGTDVGRFLQHRLKLELRADPSEPIAVGRGIDFVGWKTWWNHRLARRRTLANLRLRLDSFERHTVRPRWGGLAREIELSRHPAWRSSVARSRPLGVGRLHSSLSSYAGHLRHGGAARDWVRVWQRYPWLALLFDRDGWRVVRRWSARAIVERNFPRQYWKLVCRARLDCLIFTRVGRFIEFYGSQRLLAERSLGLRTARAPRGACYAFKAGFPARLASVYRSRAIRSGLSVVDVVVVDSVMRRGCKPRLPVRVSVVE